MGFISYVFSVSSEADLEPTGWILDWEWSDFVRVFESLLRKIFAKIRLIITIIKNAYK